jgi:hypothetical protein
MKPRNFFSKMAIGVLLILCFAATASQANAELKINSVYPTLGIKGKDLPVTISGSGFDANTRVSMYLDVGNQRAIIGSIITPGFACDVKINNNIAYIADGNSGFQVIDVSKPSTPVIIGSVDTPGYARSVTVSGNYAYVADGNRGLQVINVSNPSKPVIVGAMDTPSYANFVTVSGNYAYVAVGDYNDVNSGLQVIDVSNPSKPVIVGAVDTPCSANSVTVSGDYAYVAVSGCYHANTSSGGLYVIDVSNPSKPLIIWNENTLEGSIDVKVLDNFAYMLYSGGLKIFDISFPLLPLSIPVTKMFISPYSMMISGSIGYIANSYGGLSVVDISEPSKPIIIGSVDTPGDAKGIFVAGNKAYVADSDGGLQIIDVSYSLYSSIVSSLHTTGHVSDIDVVGNLAYIAAGNLQIADVSDPVHPMIIGSADIPASTVSVVGNTVYVGNDYISFDHPDNGRVYIVDANNPSKPFIKNSFITGGANKIVVAENYAYIMSNMVQIYDVHDPLNPVFIRAEGIGLLWDFSISEDLILMACDYDGVNIFDRKDPKNPILIGSIDLHDLVLSVALVENIAYVGGYEKFYIVDVSDPTLPKVISYLDTTYVSGVKIIGKKAYIITNGGLKVIDISSPTYPIIIGSIDTFTNNRFVIVGDWAYIPNVDLLIYPIPKEIIPINVNRYDQINMTLKQQIEGHYRIRVFNNSEFYQDNITFVPPEDSYLLDTKAIIVTGDQGNNPIRQQTLTVADYAYKTLLYQGYTAESVNYLSFDTSQPGVDGKASLAAISDAINNWSIKDPKATELLIYLVGHGSRDGYFIINDNEKLTAEELDQWLDNIQNTYNIPVTVIYEACYSGSFLPKLTPPSGKTRIVISSASEDEEAKFLSNGMTSFSYQFWNAVYQGNEIGKAFRIAANQMKGYQTPRIDTDGDGIGTDAEIVLAEKMKVRRNYKPMTDVPYIYKASEPQVLHDQTWAKIQAGISYVQDGSKVQRVWATIEPPDFNPGAPVTSLPEIELTDPDGDGIYEGIYTQLTQNGTYKITVCAMNQKGMYALFKQTTVVRETGYIADFSKHQNISQNSAKIWAALKPDIPVSRVWAEIIPPVLGAPHVEVKLSDPEHDGVYEAVYDNFSAEGTYAVNLYAEDLQGYVSPAALTTVTYGAGAGGDENESDNTFELARFLRENQVQHHNFHVSGDTDWIKIVSAKNITYNIRTLNRNLCGTSVELFAQAVPGDVSGDKTTDLKDVIAALRIVAGSETSANILSDVNADGRIGLEEAVFGLQTVSGLIAGTGGMTLLKSSDSSIDWTCPETGIYYLKIRNTTPDTFGQTVQYDIQMNRPAAGSTGTVRGTVKSVSGEPVAEARIISSGGGADLSMDTGAFSITDSVGKQILTVQADGYEEYRTAVTLTEAEQIINIVMTRTE